MADHGIYFEHDEDPLILVRQVGTCSDAQVEAYLQQMRIVLWRTEPYALIYDLREGVPFNSKQRAMQSKLITEADADLDNRFSGPVAFVENSMLMRGAMQAAMWLNPPTYEYLITSDMDQARRWARQRLPLAA